MKDNVERILNIELVLRRIVGYLAPRDLKEAVLVSRFISDQHSILSLSVCCILGLGNLS